MLNSSPALPHNDGDTTPFLPHWHVREVARNAGVEYEVLDSNGAVVAANVKSLELARLFALAPEVFENFKRLEREAVRALFHMLDVNQGTYDVEEVASDLDGEWERVSPGAPDFARWLMEVEELREAVGEQQFPPPGVPRQVGLFAEQGSCAGHGPRQC